MKKLNQILYRGCNWAVAGMLSLLGYSCSGDQPAEYGSPHANFEIKGKVLNKAGEAIPDIQIQIATILEGGPGVTLDNPCDTLPEIYKTDPQGKFNATFIDYPKNKVRVIATDIDSTQNGSYQDKTELIEIKSTDYSGKNGWFEGNVKKEIIITLDEKK